MRKQLQRVFWCGMALTLTLALATIALLIFTRIQDVQESMTSILQTASAWTEESTDNLPSLAQRIAKTAPPLRVTFITDQGLVVADSEKTGVQLENHLKRPEVQQALRGGIGRDVRMSDTVGIIGIYAAISVGPRLILRLSYPLHEIQSFMLAASFGTLLLCVLLYVLQQRVYARFLGRMVDQMNCVLALLDGEQENASKVLFPEFKPFMQRIAYRVQRINADMKEINDTLTLRQRFVANASHELKSPLTSIRGFAEMLHEGMAESPEEQEMFVDCILNECIRMQDVIEDILMVSRAEMEDNRPRQEVHVEHLAREIESALSVRAAGSGISLSITGQMRLQAVEKDIWEILYNLMENAIRYGRDHGQVHVCLTDDTIAVRDDGIGIAAEHIPLLFEPFYRVDSSNGRGTGTGLGLPIVKRLAEKYGARVDVESQPGKGSCFVVRFVREL